MLAGGIFFCLVPFWPGASGDISPGNFFRVFAPFWGGAFARALHFINYRVVVRDATLTVGAFWRRVIPFTDVVDWNVVRGNRSSELWIYRKNGKRLKFTGLLGDFENLVGMVNSHMEGLPGPHHDSRAKIRDRAARLRSNRVPNCLVGAGVLVIAILILVLRRMELT